MPEAFDVVIYHNPACGTSRNTLAMIRNAGIEPHVVEYLKTPPSRALLRQLLARAGLSVRDVLREKGTPYAELGLDDPALTDAQLLDARMHVTPFGHPLAQIRLDVLGHLLEKRRRGAAATRTRGYLWSEAAQSE